MNWNEFDRGIFLVNSLAIIFDKDTNKILIGKRENDPYLKNLSWGFPGGRPNYSEDLEFYLKHEVRIKTGLEIGIKQIIFAKTYPEKREFLSLYYLCERIGGVEKAGEKFTEIKWVEPGEVEQYFTTSIHPEILKILKNL